MAHGQVDFVEEGDGPMVVLLHSSVAGARQWRSLMDDLSDRYRLVAVNLFGYGQTPDWDGAQPQKLEDQARLLEQVLPDDGSRIHLVGHSFGGSVAMKAASLFPTRIEKLVLIEPNPFYLLQQNARAAAYQEATSLRDCIKTEGARDNWDAAAAVFADYWTGAGSWAAMPEARQAKFAEALKPNFHEWDAVMTPDLTLAQWRACLPRQTTVISAADTVRSIKEIVALLSANNRAWTFETLDSGGHMAPLSHPHLINPMIARALA